MRILLVIDSFYTGGAEFSTLELFRFLKEKNIFIHICKIKEKQPQYDYQSFELDENSISTLPSIGFLGKRKALKALISDFKPDIVHSVLFKSNLMVRTIRFFDHSFVHLESLVNHTYSKHRLQEKGVTAFKLEVYRWLDMTTSYFGTDYFHPNGYSVAAHYQKRLCISPKRMTVVQRGRSGSDYEVTPELKSKFGINDNQLVFINVARQEYQKGQDVLLTALTHLPPLVLEQIHLLIVGREGKATASLQKQLQDSDFSSKVTFLGHRTNVSKLLKMSDVFVFPSRYEGLPGVLIEAEASGLPIICTDLPMMLEVIEVNENALIFSINDAKQLAKAMEKLVLDSELRKSFGIKSKAIFKTNFEIDSVHVKMMDLYKKLIKQ